LTIRAAIDVGSNSVKLLVLDISRDGTYEILHDSSQVTGLGRGVSAEGLLSPQAISATLSCIRDLADQAHALKATSIKAAGTAALRNARNREQFVAGVEREAGVRLEVISGEEEAHLSRVVGLRELKPGVHPVLFFDVGGGSTELTLYQDGEVVAQRSLDLGARRCTEEAALSHPVKPEMRQRLLQAIHDKFSTEAPRLGSLQPTAERNNLPLVQLAGLGGTATTLVWMLDGLEGKPKGDPHLRQVLLGAIERLLGQLEPLGLAEARQLPNLDPKRADVIYAGATIIAELMHFYLCREFLLVDRGLRFGLLLG